MHLIFLFAVVSSILPHGASFSPGPARISSHGSINSTPNNNLNVARHHYSSPSRTTRLHSTDDKDAEIAALEERLKQLKEPESPAVSEPEPTSMELTADDEDDADFDGETEDSVMFSERWKEAKDGYLTKEKEVTMEKNMGGLANVAKVGLAVGGLVLLGLFSQVHIGEDNLQRYQDIKGSPSRIDLGDLNQ